MLILFFNYYSEPIPLGPMELTMMPTTHTTMNIYQVYVMNVFSASMFAMFFNMFCARYELGNEWIDSSFVFNRWTFIELFSVYSGITLWGLMFFIPNSIILWRIYQVISFILIVFLDLDKVAFIFNYCIDKNNQFEKFLKQKRN
jgi:hypothetical protein